PTRSHVRLQAIRSRVQPGSLSLFLVAGLFFYVLNGVAFELPGRAILGRIVVACAGLYVLSANRVTFWLAILVILSLVSFEARVWTLDPRVARLLQDAIMAGFLLWVLVVVLREVFRPVTGSNCAPPALRGDWIFRLLLAGARSASILMVSCR